ncbi:unnamed protein product, partial [marine sediment metagenome]
KFKNGAMGVIEGSTALYPGLPEETGFARRKRIGDFGR